MFYYWWYGERAFDSATLATTGAEAAGALFDDDTQGHVTAAEHLGIEHYRVWANAYSCPASATVIGPP